MTMQDMPASEIAVLKQAAKDTPEAWVAIGMAVQWLVEQFGTSYGLSYDTVMSWITAISEATKTTDGGSMTAASAMVFAVARIGYKYFRKGTS
jgi:hypothetical protein